MRTIYSFLLCFTVIVNDAFGLIPKPFELKLHNDIYTVQESIHIAIEYPKCFVLNAALKRFTDHLVNAIFSTKKLPQYKDSIVGLKVKLHEDCNEVDADVQWPSIDMDESYNISVDGPIIHIEAQQVWGAIHALESLAQLITRDANGKLFIQAMQLHDKPRFKHRGFLVDTSRHFISKPILYEFIDAMAMVKMNVLHWHIVDDNSFPYTSYSFPELATKGAYNPDAYVYTQDDIKEILNYARHRGIRVVPEFDSPGHTQSWGKGQTDLLTKCCDAKGKPTGGHGPVDPSLKSTYDFMGKLFAELGDVFPDKLFHLGGDEVNFNCWKSNPNITAFMKEKGLGNDYSKLQSYYISEVLKLLAPSRDTARQRDPVVWQEVYDHAFRGDKRTIIQAWYGNWKGELQSVTSAGYRAILSTCWYLDLISYGRDWPKYYNCEPTDFTGTDEQKKLILGGEACIWSEYTDDASIISRSWPRGAPIAERLWSQKEGLNSGEFGWRLDDLRCLMLKRGVNAGVASGPGFCQP